jgi:hypothetical protein
MSMPPIVSGAWTPMLMVESSDTGGAVLDLGLLPLEPRLRRRRLLRPAIHRGAFVCGRGLVLGTAGTASTASTDQQCGDVPRPARRTDREAPP